MPARPTPPAIWIEDRLTPWDTYQHGVDRILARRTTAYQEMLIVESGSYGRALVLDGSWQSSVGDEFLYHEPLVQPAMLAHGNPRRVLVLGGGEGATVREVLRWKSVERAVMVDIDGEVVGACREHLAEMHQGAFDDARLELIIDDAREFLASRDKKNPERWDVIVSDLSDPVEEGPSHLLFTREFFARAAAALAEDGVLVVQAGSLSPAEITLHARLVHTLESVFPHVHSYGSFVPTFGAVWGFALASQRPLTTWPDPAKIDNTLASQTTGGLRMLDGHTLFLFLLQTPLHVRRAIANETVVYTEEQPPSAADATGVDSPLRDGDGHPFSRPQAASRPTNTRNDAV